jgi:2-oxo-4-hydroxy-4-carboxy-5-ureidoimidazoline decarboxylase
MLTLRQFNSLNPETATAELLRCCGSKKWAEQMVQARPFQNPEALFQKAGEAWAGLSKNDWLEAFAQHPKIGDLDSFKQKFSKTKSWSEGEQAGVNAAPENVLVELAACNRLYEEKFGFIFIVCATGKTAGEMLNILKNRMANNQEDEIRIAAEEQRKITRIRLGKLLQ